MKIWEKISSLLKKFQLPRRFHTADSLHVYSSSACRQTFRLGEKWRWMKFFGLQANSLMKFGTKTLERLEEFVILDDFTNHHEDCLKEFLNLVSAAHFHRTISSCKSIFSSTQSLKCVHLTTWWSSRASVLHFFYFSFIISHFRFLLNSLETSVVCKHSFDWWMACRSSYHMKKAINTQPSTLMTQNDHENEIGISLIEPICRAQNIRTWARESFKFSI